MKNFYNHEMGCWYFRLKSPANFTELEKSVVTYPFYYMYSVYFILKKFREENLFDPKMIIFSRAGNSNVSIESLNDEQIIIRILEEMNREMYSNNFIVEGTTSLLVNGVYQKYEQVLSLTFELNCSQISIATYSDCWIPIDGDDNLQIELAKDSSKRLERCLDAIDSKLPIIERTPPLNEENTEYGIPVIGNKVYMYEENLEWVDDLTKEQLNEIQEFIWEKRYK